MVLQAVVQENLATSLFVNTSASTSRVSSPSPSCEKTDKAEGTSETQTTKKVQTGNSETTTADTKIPCTVPTQNAPFTFLAKPPPEKDAEFFKQPLQPAAAIGAAEVGDASASSVFKFGVSGNSSASQNAFEFTSKPTTVSSSPPAAWLVRYCTLYALYCIAHIKNYFAVTFNSKRQRQLFTLKY